MLFFFSARRVSASSSGLSSTSSTILLSSIRSSSSEREIDRRPLVGSADGPDATAVPVHDPLDGGQTDPDARELVLAVQTLERAEQLVGEGHVEAGAVVLDEVPGLTRTAVDAELDPGRGPLAGELPGVPDQVLQDGAQERLVPLRDGPFGDHALDLTPVLALAQIGDDLPRQRAEVDTPTLHFGAGDAGKVQEAVDELAHLDGGRDDPLERVPARLVEGVGAVFHQGVAEPLDAPKGRPQVVRHGVREGLELLVGGLELGGPLGYPLLQAIAGGPEIGLLLPDLLEHLVEGPDERTDLVPAAARGADGVVLLQRDLSRGLGEPEDRLQRDIAQ